MAAYDDLLDVRTAQPQDHHRHLIISPSMASSDQQMLSNRGCLYGAAISKIIK